MKLRFELATVALCAASILFAPGCARKARDRAHAARIEPTAPAPTPDTTPVESLRTPAGVALRVNPAPVTPSPKPTASELKPAQSQ